MKTILNFKDKDTFSKLERQAYDGTINVTKFPPAEYKYFSELHKNYYAFKFDGLSKEEAYSRKQILFRKYTEDISKHERCIAVYAQFQENPCHICETPVLSWSYIHNTKYTCPKCRELLIERKLDIKSRDWLSKQERCLNRAIGRIAKQTDIKKYGTAISCSWVKKHLGHSSWFQSTEEVMVEMELIRKDVKAHHQVKIYNYSVDFILPEMKVALEIDGKLYHGKDKEKYSEERDRIICEKLGEGWEGKNISVRIQCV